MSAKTLRVFLKIHTQSLLWHAKQLRLLTIDKEAGMLYSLVSKQAQADLTSIARTYRIAIL